MRRHQVIAFNGRNAGKRASVARFIAQAVLDGYTVYTGRRPRHLAWSVPTLKVDAPNETHAEQVIDDGYLVALNAMFNGEGPYRDHRQGRHQQRP